MSRRASGILLHPTSLSNPYPIGDLGPAATAFADFMVASGQRYWQMLPIGLTGKENSPYQSLSAFVGFVRTYEVPANAKTAVNGQYQSGEGASFFEAAREALGLLPLIADDLGATTPEVVALLDQLQIPGTRVLQFEFGSDLETNSALPGQHPVKSVVDTGTHDNDTTAGWYRNLPSTQREALQKQLGANDREVVWAMIREALASQAETAIAPAQDLLELGSEARMNFPGIEKGNWQWRSKHGALTEELAQRLRQITTTYGRLSDGGPRLASRCQEDDPKTTLRGTACTAPNGSFVSDVYR